MIPVNKIDWTPEMSKKARRLLSEGMTKTAVARELGISRRSLGRYLSKEDRERLITITDLKDNQCKWPTDYVNGVMTFCGAEQYNDLVYCKEHASRAYYVYRYRCGK